MSVQAIQKNYEFDARDTQKNYGDNMLLYVGWDHHTLFCAAHAFVVSPQQSLQDLINQQIQAGFNQHPDFEHIDWSKVQFTLNRERLINIDFSETLANLNFDHKSLLRFVTPDLDGYDGTHV
ncbi:phenol hydroxylase P4 protein [Acinetobacter baylyi]|uniref:Phenol hydroxylase P4 protein n=1 Tax=Acinetobacter baylyi TaxID=202950 RepID=A0ABU0URP7_ACIBI|nr:phenol hydroxylase subunit P4 [Acinetobacter baylyi]MDQ1207131.1 phenol hydroxylase P4 protein [Acinetobacter baylyi]MDR6108260.1 phenol hydroxylase P4 protein [Acinetobacter baylyi]MDR6184124.1 phenol hydroxylase P4 protein [Acinetobacter baylyi]